jgi:hypothetical protein
MQHFLNYIVYIPSNSVLPPEKKVEAWERKKRRLTRTPSPLA